MRGQRAVNRVMRGLLATPGLGRILDDRLVTLYVVGRNTGRTYPIPIAYLEQGAKLLIGTSSAWAWNLRSGMPIVVRLRGRLRWAKLEVVTDEAGVVAAYALMAATNPAFARFNRIHVDPAGNARSADLHAAWAGGAKLIKLAVR